MNANFRPFAFYNEIDPYAADWLENLIARGDIAPGVVDRRSIEEIAPDELRGFRQVHFFAGIGVWSLALRRAGVPDDAPVWTGSCPCQPFSSAGKGGGMDDERHLWPAFHHLLRECRPELVFGEQVASKDGLAWLDLVSADMEGSDYAFGHNDLCAAGFGAPHIRQRLFWVGASSRVADRDRSGPPRFGSDRRPGTASARVRHGPPHCGGFGGMADRREPRSPFRECEELRRARGREEGRTTQQRGRTSGGLADDGSVRCDSGFTGDPGGEEGSRGKVWSDEDRRGAFGVGHNGGPALDGTGPTNGFWRDADWLGCRDGRWRPVEPGTFPLAHGAPSRVGRLRAYGNAIVEEVARNFIECSIETLAAGTVFESDGWELIG